MKNILSVFILASGIILSCSTTDEYKPPLVLPSKRIVTDEASGSVNEFSFNYEKNKLVSVKRADGTYSAKHFYEENLLSKIIFLNRSDVSTVIYELTYNEEQLVSFIRFDMITSIAYLTTITYNENESVTLKTYSGNFTTQDTYLYDTELEFANGNIIYEFRSNSNFKFFYSFDGMKHPQVNQFGIDVLQLIFGPRNISKNNMQGYQVLNLVTSVFTNYPFEITYNDGGYPTEIKEYGDKGASLVTTIKYEY
jgi:hypothetical protein